MRSVLCVYDIADSLKIANPSAKFRKWGFRINLSCWVFPQHLVPSDDIDTLRQQGATVHLVEFAEKDQEKILDLARAELRRHIGTVAKAVNEKCGTIEEALAEAAQFDPDQAEAHYKKWRAVLNKGRRELLAAQQCTLGFTITGDVQDALDGLEYVLRSELSFALAWRDQQKQQKGLVTV